MKLSLGKRRLQGDLIVVFQYKKGICKKTIITSADSHRTRGKGFKWKKIGLDET